MSEEDKMTRDEIINMPAGRELDALVDKYIVKLAYEFPAGMWNGLHTYSTDIAAAWYVVEKMIDLKFESNIYIDRAYLRPYVYTVTFYGEGEDGFRPRYQFEGEELPLTICRAALLAVMEAT